MKLPWESALACIMASAVRACGRSKAEVAHRLAPAGIASNRVIPGAEDGTARPVSSRGNLLVGGLIVLIAAGLTLGCASRLAVFSPPEAAPAYAKNYTALQAEPLWQKARQKPGQTTYRYMSPSCFEPSVLVRIDILPDGSNRVVSKRIAGSGNKPGALALCATNTARAEDVSFITNQLARAGFFALPRSIRDEDEALDSAPEIMEVLRDGEYHAVVWDNAYGPFDEVCRRMRAVGFPGEFVVPRTSYAVLKIASAVEKGDVPAQCFDLPMIICIQAGKAFTWPHGGSVNDALTPRLYGKSASYDEPPAGERWEFEFCENTPQAHAVHRVVVPFDRVTTSSYKRRLGAQGEYSVRWTADGASTEQHLGIGVNVSVLDSDWVLPPGSEANKDPAK